MRSTIRNHPEFAAFRHCVHAIINGWAGDNAPMMDGIENGDIIAFRPTEDDPPFLSYAHNAPAVQKQNARKGQGGCFDNIFIERLWRSLKYECVYLHAWESESQVKTGIARWTTFYTYYRPHTAHGAQPPAVVYFNNIAIYQQVQAVA